MVRYAGRIWSSLCREYGIYATALNTDQEIWIADFIHDAYVDTMPFTEAAFRIANEYQSKASYLDEKAKHK